MTFTPTPTMRTCSIAISRDVLWALRRISEASVGEDGRLEPHLTADGIGNALLESAIGEKYPSLWAIKADRDKAKAQFNQNAVKLCQKQG